MLNYLKLLSLAVLLTSISGCSTIVSGSDQPMTVISRPSDALCTLSREGTTVAVVNPTPGTITIGKSQDVLQVECEKEGFLATSEFVSPEASGGGMTGNVIIGLLSLGIGVAAVAIDSASGAANHYPSVVEVELIPAVYSSEAERDAYFDGRLSALDERYSAVKSELDDRCITRPTEHCTIRLEELESAWKSRVETLERLKSETRIEGEEA